MKKTLYTLALLTVLLLPGMGQAQEPSDNGTVPPYTLWIPAVVGPKVCEDPGITNWGYVNYRMCSSVVCWTVSGFFIEYINYFFGSFATGYAKIKLGGGGERILEMYTNIYEFGSTRTGEEVEPGTYEVSFKVMCKDGTWTNWTDWEEIVVPDEE